jgi:hypothetical protein
LDLKYKKEVYMPLPFKKIPSESSAEAQTKSLAADFSSETKGEGFVEKLKELTHGLALETKKPSITITLFGKNALAFLNELNKDNSAEMTHAKEKDTLPGLFSTRVEKSTQHYLTISNAHANFKFETASTPHQEENLTGDIVLLCATKDDDYSSVIVRLNAVLERRERQNYRRKHPEIALTNGAYLRPTVADRASQTPLNRLLKMSFYLDASTPEYSAYVKAAKTEMEEKAAAKARTRELNAASMENARRMQYYHRTRKM